MNETNKKARELLSKAVEDGRNRNYTAAVKKLKTVLNMTDSCSEALLYLGRSYHALGNFNDAIIAIRLFITKHPKSDAGWFYLGRAYIAMGYFKRAVACFKEALGIKPDFGPALAYLGYSMLKTGNSSSAVKYLGQAVIIEPENSKIYNMYINSIFVLSVAEFKNENFEASLRGFMFLEQAGFTSVSTKLYIGIISKELKNFEAATSYIREASELSPDDNLIKNILAELYIRTGNIESSMELLSGYYEQDEIKDFIDSIDNIERSFAISFWNKKQYDKALHYAVSSLKVERTADMHLLAGECLKNIGRLDDAYNHYKRASEIAKNIIEPYYGVAIILWMKEDFKSMLTVLEKINHKNPGDDFADYYKILCSWKAGINFKIWQESLEARLKKESDNWILTAKGWGLLSLNNKKDAAKSFRKALKNGNSLKESWHGLIEALSIKGSEKPLATVLNNYLKQYKNDTEKRKILIGLLMAEEKYAAASEQLAIIVSSSSDLNFLKKYAYCCRKAGKYKDAIILYRQILSKDPCNENYLKMLLFCMRKSGRDFETIQVLQGAIALIKKPSTDLILVYGVTLYRNNRNEEALNVFQKMVYNGVNDWRVYRNMGIIYKNKGLNDWAEMYLKKSEGLKKN